MVGFPGLCYQKQIGGSQAHLARKPRSLLLHFKTAGSPSPGLYLKSRRDAVSPSIAVEKIKEIGQKAESNMTQNWKETGAKRRQSSTGPTCWKGSVPLPGQQHQPALAPRRVPLRLRGVPETSTSGARSGRLSLTRIEGVLEPQGKPCGRPRAAKQIVLEPWCYLPCSPFHPIKIININTHANGSICLCANK